VKGLAYDDYYQIKAQWEARDTWTGQLIAAQVVAKNTTIKQLWQQLRQCEAMQKTASPVKQSLGKIQEHHAVVQVEALDPQNVALCSMTISKTTLEQACLKEAKQRFTQTAQMPLLKSLAATGLGNLQIGSSALLQILEGMYPYEEISNPYTRKLLQHL